MVPNGVSACICRLVGGIRCRLLLWLLVCLTHNNILDPVHVSFIHILIPNFLIYGLVNVLLFGYFIYVSVLRCLTPVLGVIVGISGLVNVARVSVIMYSWHL